MPLRFIRSKVAGVNPLQAAISTTALVKDVLSTLQFPPVVGAVAIVLLILETVQNIQTNKSCCIALARRAAQILVDIDHQMRGRWNSAPERLVQNLQRFEGTLRHIHEFMKKLADLKWSDRFLRKNSIEDVLAEYSRSLDDAAQSFQLATLIDLHYTIGTLSRKTTENDEIQVVGQSDAEFPPPYEKMPMLDLNAQEPRAAESGLTGIVDIFEPTPELSVSLQPEEAIAEIATDGIQESLNDYYLPEQLSLTVDDNHHGFRRYHQSEIILRGRSCLKEGWWAGGMEVQVQGQSALIKRYDDPKVEASRKWLRDVKMLQNLYHPNLPQMLGFSDDETPTPFVLLSNVKTQAPEAVVRKILQTASLASCMELMLRFYRDLADTAMYVQKQLNLTDSQVQDFFEAAKFRVDSQKTIVVGLPPPCEGKWHAARNYGLAHTLLNACLKMLPNQGKIIHSYSECDEVTENMQRKINHLVTLARSLLPSGSQQPVLPQKLQELIEDNDFDVPSLTLCQFSVGDLGYVPRGKDWNSFVRLRNVEDDGVTFELSFRATGEHWCWENVPIQRQPLQAFELPKNVSGWPVAVPLCKQVDVVVIHEAFTTCVKDAWQYLREHGKRIAQDVGINPEDIVLVTHAGTHQDFYVKDFRPRPLGTNQTMADPRFAVNLFHQPPMQAVHQAPGFGFPGQLHFGQPALPSIVYLFTSLSPSYEPYWSSSLTPTVPLDRQFASKIGRKTGFLYYVQLHAEDFEEMVLYEKQDWGLAEVALALEFEILTVDYTITGGQKKLAKANLRVFRFDVRFNI